MPMDDVYRVSLVQDIQGVEVMNVMHFIQLASGGLELEPSSLFDAIEEDVVPYWLDLLASSVYIQEAIIRRIHPTPGQPFVYSFTGAQGTVAGPPMPPNVAVCVTTYTDVQTRRGRGRNYFAGIDQSFIEGAVPTAAFVTAFNILKGHLLSPIQDVGSGIPWQWCHWSPSDEIPRIITYAEQRMQLRVLRERAR